MVRRTKWQKLPQKLNKGQIHASPTGEWEMTREDGKSQAQIRKMIRLLWTWMRAAHRMYWIIGVWKPVNTAIVGSGWTTMTAALSIYGMIGL